MRKLFKRSIWFCSSLVTMTIADLLKNSLKFVNQARRAGASPYVIGKLVSDTVFAKVMALYFIALFSVKGAELVRDAATVSGVLEFGEKLLIAWLASIVIKALANIHMAFFGPKTVYMIIQALRCNHWEEINNVWEYRRELIAHFLEDSSVLIEIRNHEVSEEELSVLREKLRAYLRFVHKYCPIQQSFPLSAAGLHRYLALFPTEQLPVIVINCAERTSEIPSHFENMRKLEQDLDS